MMKIYCNICIKYRKFKNPLRLYNFFKKVLSIVYSKCVQEYKTIFKEEESVEILKIPGLIARIGEYQKIYNHDVKKA